MRKFLIVITLVLLVALGGTATLAQESESESVYFQVAMWDVPRGKSATFETYFENHMKPVFEKMLADGVIIEFGFDTAVLHDPDGYSHGLWWGARSLQDLMKVTDEYRRSLGGNAATREAELDDMLTKHTDYIVESMNYGAQPVKLTSGHAIGSGIRVKRGRMNDFRQAWEANNKPIYDQLLADGTILAYAVDTPYFHTSEESLGEVWTWYAVRDLNAEHKVRQAFNKAREQLSQKERDKRRDQYFDMVIAGSHRDNLTRIIHFQTRQK